MWQVYVVRHEELQKLSQFSFEGRFCVCNIEQSGDGWLFTLGKERRTVFECHRRLPMKMTMSIRQVDGVKVVDISGRLELGKESAALRDLICDLLKNGHKQILLNLGDVHYIDSMGLGTLVGAFTTVRKQEGELKLLNLTSKVRDLMQITKLYTVFDII